MMMMMMEGADHQDQEEAMMSYKDQSQMMIIKGKRTKRQRLASPIAALTTTASSSCSAGHDDHDHQHHQGLGGTRVISTDYVGPTTPSPATLATEISTEEEEDMANCLILLAQGNSTPKPQHPKLVNNNHKASAATTSAGLFMYQCKTCDRCFPSFQALGGHRASHKKPNKGNMNSTQDHKKALSFVDEAEEYDRFNNTSTTLSLQISNRAPFKALSSATTTNCNSHINKANKVHECSVCGAEFTSGQALGGHMRRHRTFINTTAEAEAETTTTTTMSSPQPKSAGSKRPRNILQLDLNLPAPEEDLLESKFPFGPKKEQVIVFSASPLVGCHY